jgi:zinc protease
VATSHPDETALDVRATVLGGLDKESRLFRALAYDRQLAAAVGVGHPTSELSGRFKVDLSVCPNQDAEEVVPLTDQEIQRLKEEGPTAAEVRKAKNQRESELVMSVESVAAGRRSSIGTSRHSVTRYPTRLRWRTCSTSPPRTFSAWRTGT